MIKGPKVWIAGWWWLRYVTGPPPGRVPPMWAIRWTMAGTDLQRSRLADRIERRAKRVRMRVRR